MDEIPRWELPGTERDPADLSDTGEAGESLSSIARRYRTTASAIRSCNPVWQGTAWGWASGFRSRAQEKPPGRLSEKPVKKRPPEGEAPIG